ncbi:hypothetical protein ACU4I5_10840 [Ensifer adhaerens]
MAQKYYLLLNQSSGAGENTWFIGFGDGPPDPSGVEPTDIANPNYTYWGPDQRPLPSFTTEEIERLSARLPAGNKFSPIEVEQYNRRISAAKN